LVLIVQVKHNETTDGKKIYIFKKNLKRTIRSKWA